MRISEYLGIFTLWIYNFMNRLYNHSENILYEIFHEPNYKLIFSIKCSMNGIIFIDEKLMDKFIY